MVKVGDLVKVLHIDGYGVILHKPNTNEIVVCYPYCACNSGFWSLVIEKFELPINEESEQFRAESVAVQDIIRKALKNLK